jgi:tRNA A22 N-methylase
MSIRKLIDVGGDHGLLLATILRANPHMRGVLYELPPVAEGARRQLAELGVVRQ